MRVLLILSAVIATALTGAMGATHDAGWHSEREARTLRKAERKADQQWRKADRKWQKAAYKAERDQRKAERKAQRAWEKAWRKYDRWR